MAPASHKAQRVVAAVGGRLEPRRRDRVYVAGGDWQLAVQLVGSEAFYEALLGRSGEAFG